MFVTGVWTVAGTEPAPTVFSVLAGTVVTSLITLAGSAVPVFGPAGAADVPALSLMTTKAATTASTATMLPPVMSILFRTSACLAAAC